MNKSTPEHFSWVQLNPGDIKVKLSLAAKCAAELIGTFALVFAGCGSIMVAERFNVADLSPPIVFGLIIAAMIYALGHISGAHFNPAVTLSFACARHFPVKHILPYWVSQFLGAFIAMLFLFLILPAGEAFGETTTMIPLWKAIVWEAILTFFLMFVIIAVATDTRAIGTMAGAAIGATVMLCAFVGGPVTGASMNPARSLAPNIFAGEYSNLWVYFLGPFIGALLAAYCYELIRCDFSGVKSEDNNNTIKKDANGCC